MAEPPPKPVVWMGSSRADLRAFPESVRRAIGHGLYAAQQGETDPAAKPLKGFKGSSVMEIVDRYDTDTYRAVSSSTSFTRSRRSRSEVSRHRNRTSSSCGSG